MCVSWVLNSGIKEGDTCARRGATRILVVNSGTSVAPSAARVSHNPKVVSPILTNCALFFFSPVKQTGTPATANTNDAGTHTKKKKKATRAPFQADCAFNQPTCYSFFFFLFNIVILYGSALIRAFVQSHTYCDLLRITAALARLLRTILLEKLKGDFYTSTENLSRKKEEKKKGKCQKANR